MFQKTWMVIVLLCFIAILFRLPSLDQPIDNDGGARAYHARLILDGEPLYSTHHTGHHLPGIYYTYAAAMWLFGDSNFAIKLFLLLWTIPTIALLYLLGTRLMRKEAAFLAAVFYAMLSSQVHMWGLTAETELFANLPRIGAFYLLLYLLQSKAKSWQFIVVGMMSAWAFLYKLIYVSPLALAGLVLLIEYWRSRTEQDSFKQLLSRSIWVGVGFVTLLIPVIAYFVGQDLWERFLLIFTLGQSYGASSQITPESMPALLRLLLYPVLPIYGLGFNNAGLLLLSIIAFFVILMKRSLRTTPLVYLTIWFVLSFVEAGISLQLFAHYYLLLAPVISLLSAWLVIKIYEDVQEKYHKNWAVATLTGLLVVVFLLSFYRTGPYYYHFVQYKLGRETLAESVVGGWPGFGERLVRAQVLADYVVQNSDKDDLIYYWSEDVQLYYLANRRSPIDMIWPIDVDATGAPERIFSEDTELIIVDERRVPEAPTWLEDGLETFYVLEDMFDDQKIYRWAGN